MDARHQFIRRVEGAHAVIAVVGVGVALALSSQALWSGVLLGTLLGGLNFRALALLAAKFTQTGDNAGRSGAVGLIVVKMAVMMASVGAVMVFAQPDAGAFVAGISAAPISLVLVSAIARPTFDDLAVASTEVVAGSVPEVQR